MTQMNFSIRRWPDLTALVLVFLLLVSSDGRATTADSTATTPAPMVTPTRSQEVLAILIHFTGDVIVEQPGSDTAEPARAMQAIQKGALLTVADGARVTLICAPPYETELTIVSSVRLTCSLCQTGQPLPPGSYSSVEPDGGRIRSVGGSLELEGPAREKETDYGHIPIILSPRNTRLLELEPILRWVEVGGAIEYEVWLNGPTSFKLRLDVTQLPCAEDARTAPNRICSLPWPTFEGTLIQGKTYFLTLSVRTGIASPLRSSEKSRLYTLTAEETLQVKAKISAIQALDLDTVTRDLLLAGLYAERELYSEAIAAYERALAAQPAAVLHVTLGDIYRAVDLQRFAFGEYERALNLLPQGEDDAAVRAAAEFGIGQVCYARQNYSKALTYFQIAEALYTELEMTTETAVAAQAVKEAKARIAP